MLRNERWINYQYTAHHPCFSHAISRESAESPHDTLHWYRTVCQTLIIIRSVSYSVYETSYNASFYLRRWYDYHYQWMITPWLETLEGSNHASLGAILYVSPFVDVGDLDHMFSYVAASVQICAVNSAFKVMGHFFSKFDIRRQAFCQNKPILTFKWLNWSWWAPKVDWWSYPAWLHCWLMKAALKLFR